MQSPLPPPYPALTDADMVLGLIYTKFCRLLEPLVLSSAIISTVLHWLQPVSQHVYRLRSKVTTHLKAQKESSIPSQNALEIRQLCPKATFPQGPHSLIICALFQEKISSCLGETARR